MTEKGLCVLDLVLLVSDEGLEEDDVLLGVGVADGLRHLQGLIEIPVLVVTLGQIQLVLGDLWVELRELLVDSGRVEEILAHVVAVGKEGHRSASGAELQLVAEVVDGLCRG